MEIIEFIIYMNYLILILNLLFFAFYYERDGVYYDMEIKILKNELKETRRELAEAKDYISKNFYKLERNKK